MKWERGGDQIKSEETSNIPTLTEYSSHIAY